MLQTLHQSCINHPHPEELTSLDIFDIYEVATYEDLAAALEVHLANKRSGNSVASQPRGAERTAPKVEVEVAEEPEEDEVVVLPTEEEITAATASTPVVEVKAEVKESTPPVSPTATKSKKVNVEDFEEAFKNLFPDKKA